jgi:hypothetical protein
MIPKSGNRFSEKIMLKKSNDPEKWKPVFGKDHAQKSNDPEKWEPVSRLRAALRNRWRFRLMLRRAKAGRKNYAQTKKAGAK